MYLPMLNNNFLSDCSNILTFISKILEQRELWIRVILHNLHKIANTIPTDALCCS